MPSVISHPAVPLALAAAAGTDAIPLRLAAVACAASVLPDLDAIGYQAGIPYGSLFGHRGLTHSIVFAAAVAAVGSLFASRLGASPRLVFVVLFLSTASHGALDAMTDGGMGVAFFSPFSNRRYFLPWQPIRVAPLGIGRFLSRRGLQVLASERTWVWIPCAGAASLAVAARRLLRGSALR